MKLLLIICWILVLISFVQSSDKNGIIAKLTAERDAARAESATRFSSCYEMAKDPVIKQQFLERAK